MKTNQNYEFEVSRLLIYIEDYLPEVARMERPLNARQALELIRRYGYIAVMSQFGKMENYKKLHQYRSAYLTCMKWFEMDIKKGYYTPPKTAEPEPESDLTKFVKSFLVKHPPGSEIILAGQDCTVENRTYIRLQDNRLLPISILFNNKNMEDL